MCTNHLYLLISIKEESGTDPCLAGAHELKSHTQTTEHMLFTHVEATHAHLTTCNVSNKKRLSVPPIPVIVQPLVSYIDIVYVYNFISIQL